MIYFLALLPATALTIAGYFVLFLSTRSEGGLRTFGRYLGFWAFTLAGLVILGALFAAAHGRNGHCPMFCHMYGIHGMHEPMAGGWAGDYERCPFAEGSHPAHPPGGPSSAPLPSPGDTGAAATGTPPAAH